jgi:hypothetical protein
MTQAVVMPKMLWTPTGFYCTYCDYYFYPELDRSGLPDSPVKWIAHHQAAGSRIENTDCPLKGKMFEINEKLQEFLKRGPR